MRCARLKSTRWNQRIGSRVLSGVGLLLVAHSALAQIPTHPAYGPEVVARHEGLAESIDVTLIGLAAESAELGRLLSEWNPTLHIRQAVNLNATDILDSSHGNGRLRIWIVVTTPQNARLYFAAATGARYLVREVELTAGLDESGRETLAQVIATSATAFVEQRVSSTASEVEAALRVPTDAPLAVPESESETKLPPRSAKPVEFRDESATLNSALVAHPAVAWQPTFGVQYAVAWLGPSVLGQGPEVFIGAGRPFGSWRGSLVAQGQYRFPLTIEQDGLLLKLRTVSFGIGTTFDRQLDGDWLIGAQLGALIERTAFSLDATASAAVLAKPEGRHYRPLVEPALRVGYGLGQLHLTIALGARIALVYTHYDISKAPLFEPWPLAPSLALGLRY